VVEEFQVTFEYMHYMTDFNTPSIGLTVNI
jgi:hypothetical protein